MPRARLSVRRFRALFRVRRFVARAYAFVVFPPIRAVNFDASLDWRELAWGELRACGIDIFLYYKR